MRIALLTAETQPTIGGVAAHVGGLARGLAVLGHQVEVWHWGSATERPTPIPGVAFQPLRLAASRWRPQVLRESFGLRPDLWSAIARFRPDVVHVHSLAPLSLAMRWLGAPNGWRRVFTNHTSGYLKLTRSWWGRWKARLYCGAFDGLVAPSRELLDRSLPTGIPPGRCAYIPNGVDPERFRPGDRAAARCRLAIGEDRVVILATRRFVTKNGLRYLAEALDTVRRAEPRVLCVFCGTECDPGEKQAVEAILTRRDLWNHVLLAGNVANDQVATYLHACDLVVVPSLVEATSISVLEAMAAGKPVVATRVGGLPDLVTDSVTGRLCAPADSADLADKIVRVLRDSGAQDMGVRGREKVLADFTWDVIAQRTLGQYQVVLSLPPRRTIPFHQRGAPRISPAEGEEARRSASRGA